MDAKYKRCHCTPSCYKWLSTHTREHHYGQADPLHVLQSDYGSDDEPESSDEQIEVNEPEEDSHSDNLATKTTRQSSGSTTNDSGSSSIPSASQDRDTGSARSWSSMLQFDESDNEEDLHLSLEEIEDQLNAWLSAERDQEFFDIRNNVLTEEDWDNIRAFKLKMMANMPRRIYDQLWYTFRHKMSLDSEWVTLHRLALLSGIQPINIDCCVNSCIAYTQQYIHHEECPYCKEARYTRSRKARRTFCYLP
ncbi:hypothetical protein PAXINDRAFT_117019, partial [Paxillus involutus ATCC 200175]